MITEKQLADIHHEIATAKEQWLKFWLGQILPPILMRWAEEKKNLPAIAKYMNKHRITLMSQQGFPEIQYLMHGEKIVAHFRVKTTRQ